MNSRLLLCLALVLSSISFGCATTAHHSVAAAPSENVADEKAWQITLRNAVGDVLPPYGSVGIMIFTVPVDAAKILESQPPTELVPFLVKLRSSQSSWEAGSVDEWLVIVRDGLHGTPGVITNTLTNAKGVLVSTAEIPVYTYADHFSRHTPNKS